MTGYSCGDVRKAHKYHHMDNDLKKDFRTRVLDVVRRIPSGKTMTYKEVARSAGKPRAYRAVGNILHGNYDPDIPCHRVVRSDGRTGGWNRGTEEKAVLLKKEKLRRCGK
jgi:O-6-methylguanine DNA methyltransferase